MIASPMGAAGFGTLSEYFTDRTVVTYDPRGAERSTLTVGPRVHPDVHADDLHRLIATLDAGPVDLFASSGGATNALALVAGTGAGANPGCTRAPAGSTAPRSARRRLPLSGTSTRPTNGRGWARGWRSSSPS